MPTKAEHIGQAQHNQSFWSSQDLDTILFVDWVVTGIFYEALHWVEAFLATKSNHSSNHGERSLAMQRHAELQAIQTDYGILRHESENARYRCYKHTEQDVQNDLIPLASNIRDHLSKSL